MEVVEGKAGEDWEKSQVMRRSQVLLESTMCLSQQEVGIVIRST